MTDDERSRLARAISAIRAKWGFTKTQLAEILDVHQSSVSRYESGEMVPKREQVRRLAHLAESGSPERYELEAAMGVERPAQTLDDFTEALTDEETEFLSLMLRFHRLGDEEILGVVTSLAASQVENAPKSSSRKKRAS